MAVLPTPLATLPRACGVIPAEPPLELTVDEYVGFYLHSGNVIRASRLNSSGVFIADYGNTSTGSLTNQGFCATCRNSSGVEQLLLAMLVPSIGLGHGTIAVLDLTAGARTSKSGTASRKMTGYPITADGYIYWLEWKWDSATSEAVLWLMRSGADVNAATQIAETRIAPGFTVSQLTYQASGMAEMGGNVVAMVTLYDGASTSAQYLVNATLGTAAPSAITRYLQHQGVPSADGRAYGIWDGPAEKTTGAATVQVAAHWPLGFSASNFFDDISASPDLTELGLHEFSTRFIHDFAEGPWDASPRRSFVPANHPVHGVKPFLIILRDPTL